MAANGPVGIRGFGTDLTRAVLVLIDGRTVYTPLFAGTYWDVQDALLDDIDRIEVIRGPGGTIWGPNAVNGVINIITKSSKETKGALVSAGGGNVEQGFLNSRYGGGNGQGLQLSNLRHGVHALAPNIIRMDGTSTIGAMSRAAFAWTGRKARDDFTLQGDIYRRNRRRECVRPPAMRRPIRK